MIISLKNNLKQNKGFTGMDLSISIIVILISISIIATMIYNLYLTGSGIKRNVIATDYAINILETISATEYSKVTFENDNTLEGVLDTLLNTDGIYDSTTKTYTAITKGSTSNYDNNYKIEVFIEKYSDKFEKEKKQDYIKIITVKVHYTLGKNNADNSINNEVLEISTLKTLN